MKNLLIGVLTVIGLIACGLTGGVCLAAIPNRSLDALLASATHAFRGKVQRAYTSVEQTSAEWETTFGVLEIQVVSQEKGDALGRVAYIRFQSRRYTGEGLAPPGDYGLENPPAVDAKVRVFAARAEDGGLDMLTPNGIQIEK